MNDPDGMSPEIAAWPDRLEQVVRGTCFTTTRVLAQCASTQGPARDLGVGAVVATGRQTAGRGRQGRAWDDGEGRSVSVSLSVAPAPGARLCTASALGVLDALDSLQGEEHPHLGLKFPNDLVHRDGRKLAGILVEGDQDIAVIGIGINVRARDWPAGYRGVSLEELGVALERIEVLEALLPAVAARLDSDVASLSADFQQRHLPTGHQVILDVDNDRVQGRLERVDPFGTLELQMESGLLSVPVERCRMLEWAPGSSG